MSALKSTSKKELSVFEQSIRNFLKPIWSYLQDDKVTEVMINGPKDIFIEIDGKIQKVEAQFENEDLLRAAVNNIAQSVGRRIDEHNPRLDARLPNGYRIHAVLPPCARNGTTVAIRKFFEVQITLKDCIKNETLNRAVAIFLDVAVKLGKNILISGGTGSGKTTFLSTLSQRMPKGERVIVIEDASELRLNYENAVFFETRQKDSQGKGAVSVGDLLKSSLRLRPDRIIVGEVRGAEVLGLIQAMSTGHKGCMGTVHANTSLDALFRLEALAQESEKPLHEKILRHQISESLDLVVQMARGPDGKRRVVEVAEVLSQRGPKQFETYDIKTLFKLSYPKKDENGELKFHLEPTGEMPSFMDELRGLGVSLPEKYFKKAS